MIAKGIPHGRLYSFRDEDWRLAEDCPLIEARNRVGNWLVATQLWQHYDACAQLSERHHNFKLLVHLFVESGARACCDFVALSHIARPTNKCDAYVSKDHIILYEENMIVSTLRISIFHWWQRERYTEQRTIWRCEGRDRLGKTIAIIFSKNWDCSTLHRIGWVKLPSDRWPFKACHHVNCTDQIHLPCSTARQRLYSNTRDDITNSWELSTAWYAADTSHNIPMLPNVKWCPTYYMATGRTSSM